MLELGRVGVAERLGHLVEVGPGDLLAQPLHQLLEVLTRLGGDELVVLQAAHLARQVVGQQVELHPALRGHLVGDLLAALVARVAGVRLQLLDTEPLLLEHVLEFGGDLGVGPAEVALLEQLLALHADPVEEVAQTLDLLAVGRLPAPVEHALQRLVEVAVGQEIIRQLLQDRVGVVDRRLLGAVPPPVVEPPGHPRPRYVARDPAASLFRRLVRCRPSRMNSVALATMAGSSDPPVSASTGADRAGTSSRVSA